MKQTTFNLMQGALKKSAIFLGKTVLFCFYGFMAYTVFFKLYNSEMMGYVGFSLTVILSIATWKYTDLIIEEEMPWFSGFWMAFATEIELDRDEFETKYSIGRNHQDQKIRRMVIGKLRRII